MAERSSVWASSRRCIIAWLEQRCLFSPGSVNLLHSLPPGKKLARLWKDYISSSCEECGKWINFWLNCCWARCFPFHSLGQLLSSLKRLRYHPVVNVWNKLSFRACSSSSLRWELHDCVSGQILTKIGEKTVSLSQAFWSCSVRIDCRCIRELTVCCWADGTVMLFIPSPLRNYVLGRAVMRNRPVCSPVGLNPSLQDGCWWRLAKPPSWLAVNWFLIWLCQQQ